MVEGVPAETGKIRDEEGKFIPGVSGNPAGRPKGSVSIVTEIKRRLEEIPEGQKKTYLELLVDRIMKSAIAEGNDQQIKNILNYVDGMPKQSVDVTSNGENITDVRVEIIHGIKSESDERAGEESTSEDGYSS